MATVLVLAMSLLAFFGAGALATIGTNHSAVGAPRGPSHLSVASPHPLAPTVPNPPTFLTVGTVTSTSVALNWTNPGGGGLVNDTVWVGTNCTVFVWHFSTAGAVQVYTVTNLQSLTHYCFAVTAWNVTGQSNASNTATAMTRIIPGSPLVSIQFTSSLPLYVNFGVNVAWQLTVVNQTVGANNTVMYLVIKLGSKTINNISMASEIAAGNKTNFNITLDSTTVPAANGGQFALTAWADVNNSANNSNGQTYGAGAGSMTQYLVVNAPTAVVLSPSPNFEVGPGNQTIVVQYGGDFINGASVNITSAATGAVVYTESVFAVGGGTQTVAAVAPWTVTASGVYHITVELTRPYFGASSWTWNVTALVPSSSQGFIYVNTTKWVNSTTTSSSSGNIDGLNPGVLAAILLVAGLIVGMLVAFMMGRMMWGGSKPGAPQAWSAKPNLECSVCHQTFATEDELKEHSKTAHGM
jgi:hypothetical protein